ncbi:MAG: GIY-YIG nuclease family protein [Dokdonella sp.]
MTARTFRIDRGESRPRASSQARAYVYVAPCRDEELLKIGFSRTPLERLQTLYARYFDFFDLDRAFLIETDRVKDARRIERLLGERVADHSAPAPLLVPRRAAGHTEWYRGAFDSLRDAAAELARQGYCVHAPLRQWLREQLELRQHLLFDWSAHQLDALVYATQVAPGGSEAIAIERVLHNALDAYATMGCALESTLPQAVIEWYSPRH